jgi:hypothetical protein
MSSSAEAIVKVMGTFPSDEGTLDGDLTASESLGKLGYKQEMSRVWLPDSFGVICGPTQLISIHIVKRIVPYSFQ